MNKDEALLIAGKYGWTDEDFDLYIKPMTVSGQQEALMKSLIIFFEAMYYEFIGNFIGKWIDKIKKVV